MVCFLESNINELSHCNSAVVFKYAATMTP